MSSCITDQLPCIDASRHAAPIDSWMVSVLIGAGAFLYMNLFVFPHTPILLGGDQMFFWANAQRMGFGERIYRDFFQFTPPGTDFFYFVLFEIFGARIWVTNVAVLLLGVALCGACFYIARRIMGGWPALVAASLFLTLIYSKPLNATHHWFSVLAIVAAAAIAIQGKSIPRTAAVGALLATASFFTQTHGAVAAFAVTLWLLLEDFPHKKTWRDPFKHAAVLLVSFVIVLLALNAHFLATIGGAQLWYYDVTYTRHYLVGGLSQFPGLPEFPTWRRLPVVGQYLFVCMLLPVVYPLALVRRVRGEIAPDQVRSAVTLLALLGLALFLEVAFSANWLRLYAIALPGILLFVWFANRSSRLRSYALGSICVAIVCLGFGQVWIRQHQQYTVAKFPGGKVALAGAAFAKLNALAAKTEPGEFFFQATWPGVYIPLQLRNPVYLDTVWPNEESQPAYVKRSIEELETKQVRYILWSAHLNYSDPEYPSADHLAPLRDYLRENFHRVQDFPDEDELWERRH